MVNRYKPEHIVRFEEFMKNNAQEMMNEHFAKAGHNRTDPQLALAHRVCGLLIQNVLALLDKGNEFFENEIKQEDLEKEREEFERKNKPQG